jgi:hypothetical protein
VLGHPGSSGEGGGGLGQDAVDLKFQAQVAGALLLQRKQLGIGDEVDQRLPPDLAFRVERDGNAG